MPVARASLPPTAPHQADKGVADLLQRAAKQYSTCGLYVVSGAESGSDDAEFVPYPALLEEAQQILGGLQARVGRSTTKIALLLERPRDFIPAFWACILGGYIPCPLAPIRSDPDRWAKHLSHVDALLDRPLFISTGALLRELPTSVSSTHLDTLRTNASSGLVHQAKLSDPAILMLTSGSTGNSKAVELTHGNLLSSMAGRAERQQLTSANTMFNWIAFDHVAALLESHMIAMYAGATQLHAEPATVLADPLQFLRLIHRHRVSIAFAPNFLLGQINAALQSAVPGGSEGGPLAIDLSCLQRIVTGGEANVVETGRRFLDLLAPYGLARSALWPAFGMTETCAASVYSHEFPGLDANREFAAVGLPIKGLEIRIVDERGTTLSESQTGELQLNGPVIFHRYHNNEEATRAAFTTDGWFRTGDLGRVDDGRLSLVARSKDSIIVSGVNYFSHELETQLEQLDGIERSFVAAFPTRPKGADTEQLVVIFATTLASDDEEEFYQLMVAVRNTTIMLWGFRPATILWLPKSAFPKTSLGKIQRSLMRKRFEAGDYEAAVAHSAHVTRHHLGAHTPPENPLESAVADVFCRILGIDLTSLSTSVSFFDLGGTSLDILKLTHALERRFGLKAGLPLVLQNPSVRQLATHISSEGQQLVRKYDPIVPLQVTGKKTPLFCVHPGNGEILVLVNLAKYFLNDRPFYALRPRGFNEGEECFKTFEEMVNAYVDAILERQPCGPYAVAGYSLGCRVAVEIAKRLEARGEHVAFLGCIDFYPTYESLPVSFVTIAVGLALVTDLIDLAQYYKLDRLLNDTPPACDPCEYILQFASRERLAELGLDLHKFSAWARVAYAMEDLLLTHVTSGMVKTMTVFRSAGISYTIEEQPTHEWHELLARWDDFVAQPKYVDVPGYHHTLMAPKQVAAFQAILRTEIDLAFGER